MKKPKQLRFIPSWYKEKRDFLQGEDNFWNEPSDEELKALGDDLYSYMTAQGIMMGALKEQYIKLAVKGDGVFYLTKKEKQWVRKGPFGKEMLEMFTDPRERYNFTWYIKDPKEGWFMSGNCSFEQLIRDFRLYSTQANAAFHIEPSGKSILVCANNCLVEDPYFHNNLATIEELKKYYTPEADDYMSIVDFLAAYDTIQSRPAKLQALID